MTNSHGRRGRPRGASRHNRHDTERLAQVADLLVGDQRLKPTTAMRRIGINDDAGLRRLQRKWRAAEPEHLAAAKRRLESARKPATLADLILAVQRLQQFCSPANISRIEASIQRHIGPIQRLLQVVDLTAIDKATRRVNNMERLLRLK